MKRTCPAGRRLVFHFFTIVAAVFIAAPAAQAQFTFIGPKQSFAPYHFFPLDATLVVDFPGTAIAERDYIVGYNTVKNISDVNAVHDMFLNPSNPTIDFGFNPLTMRFGRVFRNMLVFNESKINIAGGGLFIDPALPDTRTFSGNLRAYDKSTINLAGLGEVPTVFAFDNSKFSMTGGSVSSVIVKENATATIDGGVVDTLSAGTTNNERLFGDLIDVGNASVTIKKGTIRNLGAGNGANVAMTGGTLTGSVGALGNAVMAFSNVNVPSAQVRELAQMTVTGGRLAGAAVIDSASLVTSNAEIAGSILVNGDDMSSATITGGVVAGAVNAFNRGSATLSGVLVTAAGAIGNATLEIRDGTTVSESVVANENGTVKVLGGVITGNVSAIKNSQVELKGGVVVSNLNSSGNGKLSILGGLVQQSLFISGPGVNEPGALFENVVSMGGGAIVGGVNVSGSRTFLMVGGSVGEINVNGTPGAASGPVARILSSAAVGGNLTVNATFASVEGGRIGQAAVAQNAGRLNLTGGQVNDVRAFDPGTTVTMFDGCDVVTALAVSNQAVIGMNGGRAGTAVAIQRGQFNMGGGKIAGSVSADDAGTSVLIFGGEIGGNLIATDMAEIRMDGGVVKGTKNEINGGKIIWKSGTIGGSGPPPAPVKIDDLAADLMSDEPQKALVPSITVSNGGELVVIGTNLAATLVEPDFENMFSLYELSGRLVDGTNVGGVSFLVENGTGATFQLLAVPEATSLALAAIALAALARFRPLRARVPSARTTQRVRLG